MLLIPILAVSLLIVIIYIAGRLTNVIDPPQDYIHAGREMVWRHLPHRYVYWDHCDRCYGRWEQTEIPESAAEVISPAGYLRGIAGAFAGTAGTSVAHTYCDFCDEDCEPDCDCDCHAGELADAPYNVIESVSYELETAVEVNHADSLSELEWRAMLLRANSPHLFRDDWYEQSRKDFSHWSVDQWRLADNYQREMRIGAYAA